MTPTSDICFKLKPFIYKIPIMSNITLLMQLKVCCNILNLMSNKSICANNGSSSTTKRWSTVKDLISLLHWSKI